MVLNLGAAQLNVCVLKQQEEPFKHKHTTKYGSGQYCVVQTANLRSALLLYLGIQLQIHSWIACVYVRVCVCVCV